MDSERGTPEVLLIEIVVSQPAVVDHRLSGHLDQRKFVFACFLMPILLFSSSAPSVRALFALIELQDHFLGLMIVVFQRRQD